MSTMIAVIAFMSFVTVVTGVLLLAQWLAPSSRLVSERLQRATGGSSAYTAEAADRSLDGSVFSRLFQPAAERWMSTVARRTPVGMKDQVRRRLLMAGNPWGIQAGEFLAIKGGLALGLPMLVVLAALLGGVPVAKAALVGLLFAVAGMVGPEIALKQKTEARQKQIARALPDVLDLLTVSVEAGLGFDAALAKVVEKTQGPLAEEFSRVLQEVRVGKPRREALRELTQRTTVDDLSAFVVAIVQADQLGVSIGKVLRIQSVEMRRKRRQRAEEAAMKAPIKMLFPLVFFIFPGLFIVLLGPAVIQVITTFMSMGK